MNAWFLPTLFEWESGILLQSFTTTPSITMAVSISILVVDFLSKALHLSESINHGTNLGRDVVGSFIVVDDQVIAHKKHRTQ